jgi:molecular chaperone DnaK
MSYGLGVDLGTTYSAAARYRDGVADVVSLGYRSTIVPSTVLVTQEGEFLVGDAAQRRGATEPERLAREFKRRIGDSVPVMVGGTPLSAEALSARLLRWIVDQVTGQEGGPPDRIGLTYPANWGLFKQELLAQVIRLAEVPRAVTLTEPDAAAISYAAAERVEPGAIIAVYDLGGGTFDAAILRKTVGGFELLGEPEGIEHRGGVDIDEAVFAHVKQALGKELDDLPADDPFAVRAVARLRQDCIEAKEALSSDTDVAIPVVLPQLNTEVRLTRGELESMVRPVLDDTIESLRRAIASAGLTPEGIDRVLLVGGSSRMPLVGQLVAQALGRPFFVDAHPKHAVALGAARIVGETWTTAIVPAVHFEPGGIVPPAPVPPPAPPPPPPPPPVEAESPSPPAPAPAPDEPSAVPPTPQPQQVFLPAPPPSSPTHEFDPAPASALAEPTPAPGPPPSPPFGTPPPERPNGAWRRRQLQRALTVVGALVVAAVIVVGVVQLTGNGDGGGDDDDGGNGNGGGVEVPTLTPAGTTPVGSFADGLVVEVDNLWVTATFGTRDGTPGLFRLDLASGEVEDSFILDGEPIGLEVADGSLWVALRGAGEVVRIDPETGAQIETVETPGRPHELSFGAGALWVATQDGILYRIDPSDNSVQATNQLAPELSSVAATDQAIYVSYGGDPGTVAAIDPESFEVLNQVQVDGDVDQLALSDSGLWVCQRSGTTVSRIDPDSFEVTAEVEVGAEPAGIAVDGDRIWVINNGDGTLSLIDGPSAEALTSLSVGTAPLTVVTSPDRVWVSLSGDNAVARVDVS